MKKTVDWLSKRDNIKIVLVLVLSLVLIVVLKIRMSGGKDADKSATSPETYKTAAETHADMALKQEPVGARPMTDDTLKPPPFLKRDLFSYRNPGTNPTRKAEQMEEENLELTATIINGQSAIAIIGNKVLGIGESVNGFEVRAIKNNEVTLVKGEKKYIMRMIRDQ